MMVLLPQGNPRKVRDAAPERTRAVRGEAGRSQRGIPAARGPRGNSPRTPEGGVGPAKSSLPSEGPGRREGCYPGLTVTLGQVARC